MIIALNNSLKEKDINRSKQLLKEIRKLETEVFDF